ncbi:malonyl-CoA decarboxylase [Aestuariicella hydrocarbonica]|uniref:Malonyl-CoA decarboxylase n=1 Tax=Pseudomaricurvus hydrocarbonicus TaxID=1470433 RepID=A0A9E5MK50_9GAMM|nr:malonyl-CoA decarboxylase [Aestuariicella hydrocarbonica]NHO66024.1 malonyl-CoA decarboxylase [Aestuariicella hydrocarbonica]
MKKFSQWVSSIAEAGREFLPRRNRQDKKQTLSSLCHELCTSKGEAMGTAIAHEVVKAYQALNDTEQLEFFNMLYREFSPEPKQILECAEAFKQNTTMETYRALYHAVEAPRHRLFSRINMAPKGTATLIKMRLQLLSLLDKQPHLAGIDYDLKHLMISWFNRGFLTLEKISWRTPAQTLEKLIAYEAVHEMSGWDDLRRRLADDRRCFAFFHPALDDEPLIFVEVALVKGMAGNVQELLADPDTDDVAAANGNGNGNGHHSEFDTAIFYSISNCQEGLRGISFGNFLIKQVVLELRSEFPQLKQFATLSPIPGFRRWLKQEIDNPESPLLEGEEREHLQLLDTPNWHDDPTCCELLQPLLTRLCAHYLYTAKKGQKPLDPVARFHLGNGARIARLNWLGDTSANGLRQSCGLLVNYGYELKHVEENHEAFVNEGQINIAPEFQKLLK